LRPAKIAGWKATETVLGVLICAPTPLARSADFAEKSISTPPKKRRILPWLQVGIPYRINVGKKLAEEQVEVFTRSTCTKVDVAVDAVVRCIEKKLARE
jgi:hypothetical protein